MQDDHETSAESRLAQACHFIDASTGGISPPLQLSTTYARDTNYDYIGDYSYSRSDNPSWAVLERVCADLDGGAEAMCFASGMAAVCAFFETVNAGEHVVAPQVMYHGSQDWLRRISEKRSIGLSLFDAADIDDLRRTVIPGKTAVVWIESPVNPTWDVIDIAAAAEIAHAAGAVLAVDATVASPVTTRALEHGADIVFHSATKYLNGHSDVVAGILVTAREDERSHPVSAIQSRLAKRAAAGAAFRSASAPAAGAVPRPRIPPRARNCTTADDTRLRWHVILAGQGRRRRGEAYCWKYSPVRARDVTGRCRKPDRTPCFGREFT
jgi:cystathionine beta-lyase/cystathionine gamma-synthase